MYNGPKSGNISKQIIKARGCMRRIEGHQQHSQTTQSEKLDFQLKFDYFWREDNRIFKNGHSFHPKYGPKYFDINYLLFFHIFSVHGGGLLWETSQNGTFSGKKATFSAIK